MQRRSSMESEGEIRTFDQMLDRAGISKAELARRIGRNPRSVSAWGINPPAYAMEFLRVLIECNRWRP